VTGALFLMAGGIARLRRARRDRLRAASLNGAATWWVSPSSARAP